MKRLILGLFVFGITMSFAAVKPGENILLNGELNGVAFDPVTGKSSRAPDYWDVAGKTSGISYILGNAPAGKGYVHFAQPDKKEPAPEVELLHKGMKLVAGEQYRISALVRTKDFESPHAGVVVYNEGWTQSAGINKFPENQDWTRMTCDITMVSSRDYFHVALFACNFKGSLDITDVKLEALSPRALQESEPSPIAGLLKQIRFFPWEPLVNRIPIPEKGWFGGAKRPEISFMCHGMPADAAYDIHYAVDALPENILPLKSGLNTLVFQQDAKPGDFVLKISLVNRATGEIIEKQEYQATFIQPAKVSDKGHRRLNNLVVEILNTPIRKRKEEQTFEFCTMRNGWIFIAAEGAQAENLEIFLDGQLKVIGSKTPRLETFRDVLAGRHTLGIRGAVNGGNLLVRSIPEIYNYCPGLNNLVPENKPFDWEFQKKYVLPAVTTQNDGIIREENLPEFQKAGYKWIGSIGTTYISAENLVKALDTCKGMNAPQYQGVSCDEQFFGAMNSILPYTEGLKRFVPKNDHIIYTWITGKPTIPGIHNDFLSACSNTCRGRGRLISEVYCRTCPTLADAKNYLDEVIIDRVVCWKNAYPGIIDRWGLIFGNFTQIPITSLAHHPNVDYKYYLDMQFNILANHPECKDMGITGYWGSRNADHELHRWCFMLTRHYCVEGKKSMLSEEYGFTYDPGHVHNNDFDEGLKGWNTTGNVTPGHHAEFGYRSHNRWSAPAGTGDHFAVLTKQDAETSTVSQIGKGFVPGKMYCLQFSTIDYKELKANIRNPRRFGINVSLGDGAEIDQEQSWVHVDKRIKGRYPQNHNVPRCNFHHVVFKALKPEITVAFDNAQALRGEALGINYVMLNPYLPEN